MTTTEVECARLNQKIMNDALMKIKTGVHKSIRSSTYRKSLMQLSCQSPGLKATIEEDDSGKRIIYCENYADCQDNRNGCIYEQGVYLDP